jgi:hypothetical protein
MLPTDNSIKHTRRRTMATRKLEDVFLMELEDMDSGENLILKALAKCASTPGART